MNDGAIKIIGLFDGHGSNGNSISSYAMGLMLDYIRNRNDVFKTSRIQNATNEDVLKMIKKAFRYV